MEPARWAESRSALLAYHSSSEVQYSLFFELHAREQSEMLIKETMNVTVPSASIKLIIGHNSCIL